ncbi:MAG: excalibur calcium-binding domain-containing protein [Burkholderiales bacterium]|nr:excalibur calcium-binding domain-containing protein [Burkholderiales bacterium]
MPFEGRLQQWNDERGFGFVEVDAARERVFVHASALPRDGTRPATGARLVFDVQRDAQGRKRAVNVRLADARNAVPLAARPAPSTPARLEPRSAARARPPQRRRLSPAWAALAIVAVLGAVAWRAQPPRRAVAAPALLAPERPVVDAEAANRRCDGRTRCSQMRSCEEATWFLKNCPGVEMDGDHDGVPCESQWCTGNQAGPGR